MIYLSITDKDGVSVATALSQLRTLVASSMASTMGQLCVHMKDSKDQFNVFVHVNDRGIIEENYDTWSASSIKKEATD